MTDNIGRLAATVCKVDGERVLVVTVLPPAGATDEVAAAYARRAEATRTGVCACGATAALPNRAERRRAAREGRVMHTYMTHEDDCPASDDAIRRLTAASLS